MIFLMFLIYFSIPTLLVFAVQYLFCWCRSVAVKLIPTAAAFGFMIWLAAQSGSSEPRCPTGAGIAAFFIGGISAVLFIGIALGWLVYLSKSGSGEEKGNESEE